MTPVEIGLWVTGGMLVLVVLGMRVAFAAALAGVVGLVWIFWDKRSYDPEMLGWAIGVAVKTADVETAQMLIDAGIGERAKYFHRSWVLLPWGTGEDELRHRLETSYDLIRAGLTKKLQATLPPRA